MRVSAGVENATTTVEIVDHGVGMPDTVLDQIFEPFVTTKPPGHGTGLGMAVVYRIVQDHGGHIDVESRPGSGTRVTLVFDRPSGAEDAGGSPRAAAVP